MAKKKFLCGKISLSSKLNKKFKKEKVFQSSHELHMKGLKDLGIFKKMSKAHSHKNNFCKGIHHRMVLAIL